MHPILENLGERILRMPFGARDWVLRAVSKDGVSWEKDASFRFNQAPITSQAMSYYATKRDTEEVWFHTSLLRRGETRWQSVLRSGKQRIWARDLGLQSLYGPCWCEELLFCVGVARNGAREIIAVSDVNGVVRLVPQDWVGLPKYDGLEDVFVLRDGAKWHSWASVSKGGATHIRHWISCDGLKWAEQGIAMESPYLGQAYHVANNPCVVRLDEFRWRMYFRTGMQPAVGNVILSAVSQDLMSWELEKGHRITPGGRWDYHGVGFPFVYYDKKLQSWVMYYGGYWGRSQSGELTRKYWESCALNIMKKG